MTIDPNMNQGIDLNDFIPNVMGTNGEENKTIITKNVLLTNYRFVYSANIVFFGREQFK